MKGAGRRAQGTGGRAQGRGRRAQGEGHRGQDEEGISSTSFSTAEAFSKVVIHCPSSIRIGITGVPGVGKSTFIEALGKYLTGLGHKLAVLAIDPSSILSKGSILGDKTRMEELAADPNAFIRPSPSAGSLGGVARKTRETIILCEAAGYNVIFVETIGVGQSETAVHSMVDFFLLLMLAGAGDELQGIKRGIMEMADALVINKADGDNLEKARHAMNEFKHALYYFTPQESGWQPRVEICSAVTLFNIDTVCEMICSYYDHAQDTGWFAQRRMSQNLDIFRETIDYALRDHFFSQEDMSRHIKTAEKQISGGMIDPYAAAETLLSQWMPGYKPSI